LKIGTERMADKGRIAAMLLAVVWDLQQVHGNGTPW
jgi:hypothetical protein